MGNCLKKPSVEKQVVYMSLAHTPHTLSTITEISQEFEVENGDPPPLHI